MNHNITLKDPILVVLAKPDKLKQQFLYQLHAKVGHQEALGRFYKSSDTYAYARFIIPKIDKPNEAWFLDDLVARNSNTNVMPPNNLA